MIAVLSECGLYRYRLERECSAPFEGSKVFAYFGVNPSTADAEVDDATVRKWLGFTQRNGGHRFIVGNLFAFRATEASELKRQERCLFGPAWRQHIVAIIADADVLVPCWGMFSKIPRDLAYAPAEVMQMLRESGKPILCLGITACGQPKHPLMLGYDTPLREWSK